MVDIINKDLRLFILKKGLEKKVGHWGSSFSCLDTIKYLYDEILTEDDIFILSKGHGAPALHAILEKRGLNPPWTIHNEYDEKNGIKATTGSLGLGLSIAVGRALGKKLKNEKGYVYCMIGDGESQEGVIWESLNIAKRFKLNNLIVMVDYNKYQAIDSVKEVMDEDANTLRAKLEAFGIEKVIDLNGHDLNDLKKLKEYNKIYKDKTIGYIMHTIKGYGIPFLKTHPTWHVLYMHEHPEIYDEAFEYLGGKK